MKIFLLFILIFLFLSGCSKKDEKLKVTSIQDTTIYNLINQIIPTEPYAFRFNLYIDKVEMNFIDTITPHDIFWAFNKEDSAFAYQQFTTIDQFVLSGKYLNNKKIFLQDSIEYYKTDSGFWSRLDNEKLKRFYGDEGFCYFFKPIFSSDLSTCIAMFGNYCGPKCAKDKGAIYKRQNGLWKIHLILHDGES